MQPLPPLLLIDKPAGLTSFGVLHQLKRLTGPHKFGHAGTLDPMATGLMLVGVDAGTKALTQYVKLDKTYLATVRLGERYDTGDITGRLLDSKKVSESPAQLRPHIEKVLCEMMGTLTLPVSAFSAIKQNGKPLYKKAYRAVAKGEEVNELPLREMKILRCELHTLTSMEDCVEMDVTFEVSSGTYVRSLAEEIGKRLGYPATLAALRRTRIGNFDVIDARTLDSFVAS